MERVPVKGGPAPLCAASNGLPILNLITVTDANRLPFGVHFGWEGSEDLLERNQNETVSTLRPGCFAALPADATGKPVFGGYALPRTPDPLLPFVGRQRLRKCFVVLTRNRFTNAVDFAFAQCNKKPAPRQVQEIVEVNIPIGNGR